MIKLSKDNKKPRILHTMLRVKNLDKSIEFYTKMLGMDILRTSEYPEGRFTLAFVGFDTEEKSSVIELTYNWDQSENYLLGNAYGHIALSTGNIYGLCADLSEKGVKVIRKPGPMKQGKTIIAFIEDPDGYKIELIEKK